MPRQPPNLAPSQPRGAWCRGLLVLERVLLAVGVVLLGVYVAACAQVNATQRAAGRSFDLALRARLVSEQHDQSDWAAGRIRRFEATRSTPVAPLGRLEIPDAGVSVMVLDGTEEWVLDRAVGRIKGTAGLADASNLGIAGHRDGIFRGLRHLEVGDGLTLSSLEGVSHYVVDTLRIVAPGDIEVLGPTPYKSLTLVTCYPFYFVGDAPRRFVVHAREVRFEPWSEANLRHIAAR